MAKSKTKKFKKSTNYKQKFARTLPSNSINFPVSSGESHRNFSLDNKSKKCLKSKSRNLYSGYQPWVKKNQLLNKAPLHDGKGHNLLQKMGWRPGEGLGKEKNGTTEPLSFEVKLDRKGLVATNEIQNFKSNIGAVEYINNKHPVTYLIEIAVKNKWSPPIFEVISESGPSHNKSFLVKVIFNDIEYIPEKAGNTKGDGKGIAATLCLQKLGMISNSNC